MGINLISVELPKLPYGAMDLAFSEPGAAAAFDDLTLSGRDRLLTEQGPDDWPNEFRTARFYPAVEYIQANRARTLAIQQVSALFDKVDIIVASSSGTCSSCWPRISLGIRLSSRPTAASAATTRPSRRRRMTATTMISAVPVRQSRSRSSPDYTRMRSWRPSLMRISKPPASTRCIQNSTELDRRDRIDALG